MIWPVGLSFNLQMGLMQIEPYDGLKSGDLEHETFKLRQAEKVCNLKG